MRVLFKIISLVFTVLFLISVALQYNDPDPLLWYAIYGVAAIVSILFFLDKLKFKVAIVLAVLYFIGIFFFLPLNFEGVVVGKGKPENIEHARESLGLLIITISILLYAWRIKKS